MASSNGRSPRVRNGATLPPVPGSPSCDSPAPAAGARRHARQRSQSHDFTLLPADAEAQLAAAESAAPTGTGATEATATAPPRRARRQRAATDQIGSDDLPDVGDWVHVAPRSASRPARVRAGTSPAPTTPPRHRSGRRHSARRHSHHHHRRRHRHSVSADSPGVAVNGSPGRRHHHHHHHHHHHRRRTSSSSSHQGIAAAVGAAAGSAPPSEHAVTATLQHVSGVCEAGGVARALLRLRCGASVPGERIPSGQSGNVAWIAVQVGSMPCQDRACLCDLLEATRVLVLPSPQCHAHVVAVAPLTPDDIMIDSTPHTMPPSPGEAGNAARAKASSVAGKTALPNVTTFGGVCMSVFIGATAC